MSFSSSIAYITSRQSAQQNDSVMVKLLLDRLKVDRELFGVANKKALVRAAAHVILPMLGGIIVRTREDVILDRTAWKADATPKRARSSKSPTETPKRPKMSPAKSPQLSPAIEAEIGRIVAQKVA
eukprot:1000270_1